MARPRSDISARIVASATARFLAEGVDGASLRAIAREAKTSLGMVYYYYPTKDDLFLAVVERVYAELLGELEVALAPDAPFDQRVRRLYARLGAMTPRELDVVRLVVREALVSSSRLAGVVERVSRGHLPLMLRTVADAVAKGEVRSDVPPLVASMSTFLLGLVPQLVFRIVPQLPEGLLPPEGAARVDAFAEVLLRGVAPPPSAPAPAPVAMTVTAKPWMT